MAETDSVDTRPGTLCEAFQRVAAIDPDAVAVRTVGGTQTLTWREYAEQVRQVAAGLAGLGIGRGDTVALMMANRVEFYPIDVGAQHVGATSFSVYNTLSPDELEYVFANAGNSVVFCEEQYLDNIRKSGVPIEHFVCIDGTPEGTISLDELKARGAADFDFEMTWRAVKSDDVATLIYTSGTTGNPKGVESTHANLLAEVFSVNEVLPISFGDRITSYLPSAHIADRLTALYLQMVLGTQITVVADHRMIGAALPDCRPTIWGAVPRVWEKLKVGIEIAVDREPDDTRRQAMQWALAVADRRAGYLMAGETVPSDLEAEHAKAEELVLAPLRAKVGFGEVRWAISGAAPIPLSTLKFFTGLGVPIAEIWGMSEVTCVATAAWPDPTKLGTVGKALPGTELKLASDGELLLRGPLVMKGYRSEPEKTAEAVDADGWLYTGDIATIDDDGYVRIVDRKKEIIINAAGKNMSPSNIENAVKASSTLVGPMMTIGEAMPYNTALITLDPDAAAGYAAKVGLADASPTALTTDPGLVAQIKAAVAAGNEKLARVEQIKRFRILPTYWEPGSDEVTLTMKLKRKPIAAKYADEIDSLYVDTLGPDVHEPAAPAPVV